MRFCDEFKTRDMLCPYVVCTNNWHSNAFYIVTEFEATCKITRPLTIVFVKMGLRCFQPTYFLLIILIASIGQLYLSKQIMNV